MTARLPIPGSDDGSWGSILNTFLDVSHNSNGSLKTTAVQSAGAVTKVNGKNPASGSVSVGVSDLSDATISSPINNQVLSYNSSTGKWVNQSSAGGVSLDTTASDIQPLGSQAAGSTGLAADAGHVHAKPSLDQLNAPAANVSINSHKLTNLANGTASTDAAAFGQIPTNLPPNGSAGGDLSGSYPNPTVTTTHLSAGLPINQGGTGQVTQQAALDAIAGATTSGLYLRGNGTHALLSTIQAGDVPTLNQNTTGTATNITDTLDQVPTAAANVALGSHKITNLANGTASTDAAAFGQIPTNLPPNGSAGGDLSGTYPNPTVTTTHLSAGLPVNQGGTGQVTQQAALDAIAGAVTSGQVLRGNGTHVTLGAIQAGDVPTLNQNTTGTSNNITATLDTVPAPAANVSINSHKLTNLANGTASTDAAAFGQIPTNAGGIGGLLASNNLSDVSSTAAARSNLGAAQGLVPTGVKTSGYTAAAGDFVPVDASGGSVTITLPTAPTDKSRVEIKLINTSGSNTVTINTGGSDVYNKSSGSTSASLSLLNQAVMLQYASTSGIWYVQSDDLPLSQLDVRFAALTGAAFSGAVSTTPATLTDGATIAVNAALSDHFRVTLGGNRTLGNPTNPSDGQKITFEVTQDATGSRTLSYGSAYSFPASVPAPTLSTSPNEKDFIAFTYNATSSLWYCVGYVSGQYASGLNPPAGDIGGTATSPTVISTHLSSPLPLGQGGTGASAQNFTGLLTPTAVKTSGYTTNPGEFVVCDASGGPFTVTLPAAPSNLSLIGVKLINTSGSNTITIAASGSDVFNKSGGSTTLSLSLANQGLTMQYSSSTAIWYVYTDDLPLSQLDSRYALLDSTATDIQPLGTQAAGSTGKAADAGHVHYSSTWTFADNGLLAASADIDSVNTSTSPVAGTVYLIKVPVRRSITVSTIWYAVATAGVGSSTGSFIGLYNSSGTLLATSTDVGGALTSTGAKSASISAQSLTGGTFVWVGMVINLATTQPVIRSSTGNTGVFANIGLSAATYRAAVNGTSQTSLPSSITPSSNSNGAPFWFGLS